MPTAARRRIRDRQHRAADLDYGHVKTRRLRAAVRRYRNPYPDQWWNLPEDHPWYKPMPF